MIVPLLAAAAAAVGYGVSTVMQAVGARRSGGMGSLAQPLVLLALVVDGLAWLLSLLALDALPLFVVQAVLASSVAVVVVLARVVLHAPTRRRDWAAVGVVVAALAVVAGGSGEQPAPEPPAGFTTGVLVASGALAVVTALVYRRGNAVLLALLSGLGYSGAAVAARAAHGSGDLLDTVLQPLALAIVVCGAVGVLAYLRALERGSVGGSAAVLSVVEVVVPGAVGLVLLGDVIKPGWTLPVAVALAAALAACVVLASSPASVTAEDAGRAAGTPA